LKLEAWGILNERENVENLKVGWLFPLKGFGNNTKQIKLCPTTTDQDTVHPQETAN